MSAAEKLRALGTQMDAATRTIVPRQGYYDAAWELHHVLPQIVAVMEAAEKAERYDYCDPDDGDGICSDPDGRWAEWQDIGVALTALDEALQ